MVHPKEPNANDKQLVALGRVLQILREEENPDVLIDTALSYLEAEFDYSLIWIGLYDRLEHRLHGKGGATPSGKIPLLKQRFLLNPGDLLEQVVIQQRPLAVPDLRQELRAGEWRKAAQTHDVQGTVIFPIRYKDRCFGVTLLGSTLWGASPRSDEKARLSMILGGLATALYQIEAEWLRQQTKHPDQPLLTLLTKLRSLSGLGARLEAVVEETHKFVQPTRTSVYWFERERRYFWRRISNRQKAAGFSEANQPASGITAQEVSSFYQALLSDQLVAIGEAHSSLKADTTSRLMQQMRARSLLAAPILFQNELLGFLAVEGNDPRIWEDEEKRYIRGAAQIIALIAPLDAMENTIEQIQRDRVLTAEIAHSIYSESDWKATLTMSAEQVCKRLRADRFLVLLHNSEQGTFDISYQSQPANRRPLTAPLSNLGDADWKFLEKSRDTIGIENLDGDLRLLAWRDRLLELGVRSLLLCNVSLGHPLEGLVVICHESPRTWSRTEADLVRVVSQQLGLILHQWQLQKQNEQQQKVNQTIQRGLTMIQQMHELEPLERSALQHIAQVLQVPLATLVTWSPGENSGHVSSPIWSSERFSINVDAQIAVQTDTLIQRVLASDEVLSLTIADLTVETRQWLTGSGIGQLLAIALRTAPDHEPSGIVLVADVADRQWSERHLNALGTLVSQLAWSRRYLTLTHKLSAQREALEQLNWYKHRSLEELYRSLLPNLKRLQDLGNPKDPLFGTRHQQIVRQLNDAVAPLSLLVQAEQWQLRTHPRTLSLVTLLKRSLGRVDGLIKQRQLWSQVHDETNLTISGDITKIELVLHELLLTACQRSDIGGRIDLWCRQIDSHWLELSITDSGEMEPRLLSELETGRAADLLAPSTLDQPPGQHLQICRSLMKHIGGELNLYKLEDNRILSRLVLPLAANDRASTIPKKNEKPGA
ncbi:GAF domain-containing protein [Stenomitos frigidus]|uniref:Histidine kinase n=1 Tax=Stenomitos frigidus ULC18 TaxID=2107698 RepID=A0A2T1EGI7_9CYAN|nr:GAF domain-containing protein [Stenomitos frigidus]PSB31824.1 histidine kinase [Stenomitos frigidus ULC18]